MQRRISIRTFYTLLWILTFSFGCASVRKTGETSRFQQHFDEYSVQGSFLLYNPQENSFVIHNSAQLDRPFTPASTFKICNSLIGLETEVIPDQHFVLPWDGIERINPPWNQDQDLAFAYKNSTVWYYQELARRVGQEKMQNWLTAIPYGNANIGGGIDEFWLSGELRITPRQQISFLQALHDGALPFSERSMRIVREIMIEEQTDTYTLRSKTGWGSEGSMDIGWYVGYLEIDQSVYYFCTCIQTTDLDPSRFSEARKAITLRILRQIGLID